MATLLEDLTSGDAHRIWASSCAVAKTRDAQVLEMLAAHLAEIKRATKDAELGGMLFPNKEHLKFAIQKIEYFAAKKGCLCRLYPKYLMFNPNTEAAQGNVRILETLDNIDRNRGYQCQCTLCDTRFNVEEGEYHYTWWQWKIAA
jgi:hypothetical protein